MFVINKFSRTFFVFGFLGLGLFAQKTTIQINNTFNAPLPIKKGLFMAGVGMTDITPPPGLSNAGRSRGGTKSMLGFRTRLKSRAIVFQDNNGVKVALVQLDVSLGSLLLHHKVAEKIYKATKIPVSNLTLSTTHNHSGPGGFFGWNLWNKMAAAAPGFEDKYFDFLVNQVAQSVIEADNNKVQAKIAIGQSELDKFTRSRSLPAHILNPEVTDLNEETPDGVFKAVNPSYRMIRIEGLHQGKYKPMGVFSTFSIHGTAIGANTDVFNADFFGIVHRDLPNLIKQKYDTPWPVVHFFTTATQGDVVPHLPFYEKNEQDAIQDMTYDWKTVSEKETRITPVNWPYVKQLGADFSRQIFDVYTTLDGKLTDKVDVKVAMQEIDLSTEKGREIDGIRLCEKQGVGWAGLDGGFENRNFIFKIKEGTNFTQNNHKKNIEDNCQGNKRVILDFIQYKFYKSMGPKILVNQMIQINEFLLVPTPFEITTVSGYRIENEIRKSYKEMGIEPPKYISIMSVSNDYFHYATTPEEFSKQMYEGASTDFGKNTLPFLVKHHGYLSKNMLKNGQYSDVQNQWNFKVLVKSHYPTKTSDANLQRKITTEPVFIDPTQKNKLSEPYWAVFWDDLTALDFKLDKTVVSLEYSSDNATWSPAMVQKIPLDDDYYDVEVRREKSKKGYDQWSARLYMSKTLPKGYYRFAIHPRNDQQSKLYSKGFMLN